ncbi:peptidase inhibitor family I36 protein [Nonomuraea soli]|uniref:Uncharacterized protein n=1 Tax=Nonomuraea soli TaxID=1032476 RepID=A0A7W0CM37_9ACTN|nr:peptidase inhibitor family I36 protein [Nonomuraea soli]MBA2893480.1 hypothetical protein [Nonomuraea soli]
MLPLVTLLLSLAGPCACTPGELCTWKGTGYTGSHIEAPQPGDVARSIMNKSVDPAEFSGTVILADGTTRSRTFCLNPGEGQSDTGEFTITRVAVRSAPCSLV